MRKIKGQGTITKLLASKVAARNKASFSNYITQLSRLQQLYAELANDAMIETDVVSFSSSHDFSEQVLSILSFVKYVGVPVSWTVYSDGTHTEQQAVLLRDTFPFLQLIKTEFSDAYIHQNIKETLLPYKSEFINYATAFPLGKKLFLYLNTVVQRPTFFLDSDVLFYQKASCLAHVVKEECNGWFLPDSEWGNLDSRYLKDNSPQHYQVNSGLFIVNKELDNFSNALSFLGGMNGKYEYFSEQNVIHILLRDNQFMPLDPRIFILNSGDQFDFSYLYPASEMAIRHYTGPVRHKMWQKNWKWHLSHS